MLGPEAKVLYQPLPHRLPVPDKALPDKRPRSPEQGDTHERVRRDIVDQTGCVTLRHAGRLHHIGIGRTHARHTTTTPPTQTPRTLNRGFGVSSMYGLIVTIHGRGTFVAASMP